MRDVYNRAIYVDIILRQLYFAHRGEGLNAAFGDGHVRWYGMTGAILSHIEILPFPATPTTVADHHWLGDYFAGS